MKRKDKISPTKFLLYGMLIIIIIGALILKWLKNNVISTENIESDKNLNKNTKVSKNGKGCNNGRDYASLINTK